ncbi:hypothetical protein SKAU_G00094020 [Synaphobranchus kaupii]|uniref:Uncharacterized protein n=1 Tax=Synaphobranchus kaupii TaxID=118154 RepID=A0A9Q1FXT7_SYNKA|nr:hypothetical protein SKAU_G00094020 [Synaphobranchus kaupii]
MASGVALLLPNSAKVQHPTWWLSLSSLLHMVRLDPREWPHEVSLQKECLVSDKHMGLGSQMLSSRQQVVPRQVECASTRALPKAELARCPHRSVSHRRQHLPLGRACCSMPVELLTIQPKITLEAMPVQAEFLHQPVKFSELPAAL